jgi:Cdc6-like AAA superfamily ATPase
MLPSEPKIFHGRESELRDIFALFSQGAPRIAILGAAGMGKTSLARTVLHHTNITTRFERHRYFVACDTVATKMELAALIGAHLGLGPGEDLSSVVVQHLARSPPTLLVLDNLDTLWEPVNSRGDIEKFLCLITDVQHLALMVLLHTLLFHTLTHSISDYHERGRTTSHSAVDKAVCTAIEAFGSGGSSKSFR